MTTTDHPLKVKHGQILPADIDTLRAALVYLGEQMQFNGCDYCDLPDEESRDPAEWGTDYYGPCGLCASLDLALAIKEGRR
jgi:hypothetical protein